VTLGAYCFIGAGAVVTKSVLPFSLMVGVPANLVGWVCHCGVRLQLPTLSEKKMKEECNNCKSVYRLSNGELFVLEKKIP
jgi:UDP-2-acetamido-3-amino-2,3-dideoxy-glucuronate N-acetyltransferase